MKNDIDPELVRATQVVGKIGESAKEAGRRLVKNGEMFTETLNTVSRELIPLGIYIQNANHEFQQAIEAMKKK
jgi:hypothetical protein